MILASTLVLSLAGCGTQREEPEQQPEQIQEETETMQENTEQNNETVHSMIRQHNRKFMTEFQDYSYHIEEEGELVAGVVAEAVFEYRLQYQLRDRGGVQFLRYVYAYDYP